MRKPRLNQLTTTAAAAGTHASMTRGRGRPSTSSPEEATVASARTSAVTDAGSRSWNRCHRGARPHGAAYRGVALGEVYRVHSESAIVDRRDRPGTGRTKFLPSSTRHRGPPSAPL